MREQAVVPDFAWLRCRKSPQDCNGLLLYQTSCLLVPTQDQQQFFKAPLLFVNYYSTEALKRLCYPGNFLPQVNKNPAVTCVNRN